MSDKTFGSRWVNYAFLTTRKEDTFKRMRERSHEKWRKRGEQYTQHGSIIGVGWWKLSLKHTGNLIEE